MTDWKDIARDKAGYGQEEGGGEWMYKGLLQAFARCFGQLEWVAAYKDGASGPWLIFAGGQLFKSPAQTGDAFYVRGTRRILGVPF